MTNESKSIIKTSASSLVKIKRSRKKEEQAINERGINITIEQAINQHIEGLNPHTARAKKAALGQFSLFLTENNVFTIGDLASMSTQRLESFCQAWLDQMIKAGKEPATVSRNTAFVRTFFRYLHKWFPELVSYIPILDDQRYKYSYNKCKTNELSVEEWVKLKDRTLWSKNSELHALLCFSLYAGGRRYSECAKMKWEDIDFSKNEISIRPAKKKSDQVEILPLSEKLKEIMLALKAKRKPEPEDTIFKTSNQSVDKSIKKFARQVDIEKVISFHSLRTTFITWGHARGDSLSELMNASLHVSTQMLRKYDRTNRLKNNSINKLNI